MLQNSINDRDTRNLSAVKNDLISRRTHLGLGHLEVPGFTWRIRVESRHYNCPQGFQVKVSLGFPQLTLWDSFIFNYFDTYSGTKTWPESKSAYFDSRLPVDSGEGTDYVSFDHF